MNASDATSSHFLRHRTEARFFQIFHKNPLLEFYPPQGSSIINNFLCSSLRSEFADFNVTNDSSIEVLHLLEKSADNNASDISLVFGVNTSLVDISNNRSFANFTALEELRSSCRFDGPEHLPHPNTALFSVVLTFGTFLLAYVLKSFRNSKFLGRNVGSYLLRFVLWLFQLFTSRIKG